MEEHKWQYQGILSFSTNKLQAIIYKTQQEAKRLDHSGPTIKIREIWQKTETHELMSNRNKN